MGHLYMRVTLYDRQSLFSLLYGDTETMFFEGKFLYLSKLKLDRTIVTGSLRFPLSKSALEFHFIVIREARNFSFKFRNRFSGTTLWRFTPPVPEYCPASCARCTRRGACFYPMEGFENTGRRLTCRRHTCTPSCRCPSSFIRGDV